MVLHFFVRYISSDRTFIGDELRIRPDGTVRIKLEGRLVGIIKADRYDAIYAYKKADEDVVKAGA